MPDTHVTPPAPYRCIRPYCGTVCSACNHAIPGDNVALVLVADLLAALEREIEADPRADSRSADDSALANRASAFLCDPNNRRLSIPPDLTPDRLYAIGQEYHVGSAIAEAIIRAGLADPGRPLERICATCRGRGKVQIGADPQNLHLHWCYTCKGRGCHL